MNAKSLSLVRSAVNWPLALGLVAVMLFSAVSPAYAAVGTIQSITVNAQGSPLTYGTGGSAAFVVDIVSTGQVKNVSLGVAGLPAGATGVFNPAKVSFNSATTLHSTLTITATGTAPAGARPFSVNYKLPGASKIGSAIGNGTLTIGARLLDVQGTLVLPKAYDGNTNATLNTACSSDCPSLVGIVNGDPVTLNASNGHGVFASKDAGVQDVSVTGLVIGGTGASNYALPNPVLSSALISKASLIVTSDDSFTVSGNVPSFSFTYGGFAASEDASVIDVSPTCDVPGSDYSLGTHPISCSGASDNNYSFTYDNAGILTVNSVNKSPSDISLSNQTIGQNVPVGAVVGNLSTVDEDSALGETYSYSLPGSVLGHVCTDNGNFQVDTGIRSNSGVPLKTNAALHTGTYNICVQTDDHFLDGTFVKDFAITVLASTDTFVSNGLYDGWILESGELTNVGGTKNAGATTLRVGDDANNSQYRSILSFDTSSLPDSAQISEVTLKVMKQRIVGGNKIFTSLKGLLADVNRPSFSKVALQLGDFKSKPAVSTGMLVAGTFGSTPDVNGWYSLNLKPSAIQFVNVGGTTQFRIRFAKDDNNNHLANYLLLYSGNAGDLTTRPQLVITYSIP